MRPNESAQRTILPKTKFQAGMNPHSPSDRGLGGQDSPIQKPFRSNAQSRSNIRSACLACRQRRSKCTGGSPCKRCEGLNTDCLYDESHDRRTKAIRERGREELELHRKVLDGVFDAIRHGDRNEILTLVRGNASLSRIATAIDGQTEALDGGAVREESTNSETIVSESDTHSSHANGIVVHRAAQLDGQSNSQGSEKLISSTRHDETLPQTANPRSTAFRYMEQPVHPPPSVNLDYMSQFYLDFRTLGAQLTSCNPSHYYFLGTSDIRCELLFRPRLPSDPWNVYAWASAVVNQFSELDIFFQLAWLVLLVRYMKWSIELSLPSFEALPELMRPTNMQLALHHVPFFDLAPLPKLRDALIQRERDFGASISFSGISVGWDRPLEEAVRHDLVNGGLVVCPDFVQHISNEANYTFGRAIMRDFPELESHVTLSNQHFIAPTPFLSPLDQTPVIA